MILYDIIIFFFLLIQKLSASYALFYEKKEKEILSTICFGKTIFSEHLEKENKVFRAVETVQACCPFIY